MKTTSKRVFDVLARAPWGPGTRRGLTVSLLGALAFGILTVLPATSSQIHLATVPAASGGWLTRLNTWRTNSGVPTLTENTTWSQGDHNHALYMVRNDLVTHYETPGVPYYTVAGDTAARNGNIQVSSTTSSTDEQAIDWWMAAPFHAMAMMDPRLTQTGFGSYRLVKSGWQEGAALDTSRGNPFTGGKYPVYFPGNGSTEPLKSYTGGEFPNPLQACSGYAAPTGLPVFVEIGGNVATTVGAVHSFTGNGVALSHCVIDSNNAAVGSYLHHRGAQVLIPVAPPGERGVKYVAALFTVNGKPLRHVVVQSGAPLPSARPSAPPRHAAPPRLRQAPQSRSPGSASRAVQTLSYEFWTLAPGSSTWQLARGYSATAGFTWNTTGKAAGTYRSPRFGPYRLESNTGINSSSLCKLTAWAPRLTR